MNYLDILENYHEEMLTTLGELIAFPSVQSQPVKTAEGAIFPFGRDVQDAFEYMIKKGESFGFTSYNADNCGGHLEWAAPEGDEKPETFAVVGHLDVVPAGYGWKTEPFEMVIKDECIYGRGVSDDKGPLIASLYAMRALKEAGIVPKKNIRLIMGLDEEHGMTGINRYFDMAGQPDAGFTPDSTFPLINGEKGILTFDFASKLSKQTNKEGLRLTKLVAGTVSNAVPGTAKAVIAADDKLYELVKDRIAQYVAETEYDVRSKKQGSSLVIETMGITAHASMPEMGLNALSILMDFLGRLQFSNDEINEFIDFYNEHIGFDIYGERLGCEMEDEPSGKLTVNVGLANINEEIATVSLNIRYPVTCNSDQVYEGVEKVIENSRIGMIKDDEFKPIYMDLNSPLVDKLMSVYREETGDNDAQPICIGGGTYAKATNNTLAFGALFPDAEDTMHQANEKMSLEDFYKMARIYAKALYTICC